jgi:hypothetical protein
MLTSYVVVDRSEECGSPCYCVVAKIWQPSGERNVNLVNYMSEHVAQEICDALNINASCEY